MAASGIGAPSVIAVLINFEFPKISGFLVFFSMVMIQISVQKVLIFGLFMKYGDREIWLI